jgi:hypothetical protein
MKKAASRFRCLGCSVPILVFSCLAPPAFGQTGSISGSLRATGSLQLVNEGGVTIYDETTRPVAFTGGGEFNSGELPAGTYYLIAEAPGYRTELWQDRHCIDDDCEPDLFGGTPVTVSAGQVTGGIDFVLQHYPRIGGRVVASGSPLANREVVAFYTTNGFAFSTSTDAQGIYRLTTPATGSFKIAVFADDDYYQEVWEGVTCGVDDCDVLAVGRAVTLTWDESAANVDFALEPRDTFFRDGFESGGFGAWSEVQGN